MQFLQLVRGRRPDRGNAGSPNIAHVMKSPKEILEEGRDTVRAGENEPIVGVQFQHRVHEILPPAWRFQLDGWNLQHIRSQIG